MPNEGFSIEGLDGFRQLLLEAPDRLGEALYRGTRRSLGGFRKQFLEQVPANIRGKSKRGPGGGGRTKTIGQSFRWEVTPDAESQVQIRPEQVSGEIFTESRAAHGLEVPGTVRPKQGRNLAIPIALPGKPNAAKRGGPLPTWKTLALVYARKRSQYAIFFLRKASGGVTVMAQKKVRRPRGRPRADAPKTFQEPAFPIFYLTPEIVNEGNRLRFFQTWDGINRQTIERFEKEIGAVLRAVARERSGRRGLQRS